MRAAFLTARTVRFIFRWPKIIDNKAHANRSEAANPPNSIENGKHHQTQKNKRVS